MNINGISINSDIHNTPLDRAKDEKFSDIVSLLTSKKS